MRKVLSAVFALATVATSLVANARPATPKLLADGVYMRPAYRSVVPSVSEGTLRAGAANGDISPPFGTASTGFYVIRHCATSTGLEPAARFDDIQADITEDPTEAPYAPSSCAGPKLGPDTDLYPKTFPSSFGRYGRLRANAFVIEDTDGIKVAVVSVDLPGFFGEMHQAVANRISALGIARENLLVSASHTHTGPGGYFGQNLGWAALGGDLYDPRIFNAITSGIVDAIERANAALKPALLATGSIEVNGLNGNRRGNQFALNPEAATDPRNAPRIGMIRIDASDGSPIGAITTFSSHGVIGDTENLWLTGDDKGWVSRLVEDGIGGGAVVASLNGAQGDIGAASANTGGWPGGGSDWGGFQGPLELTHTFGQLAKMEDAGRRQAVHQLALWASLEGDLTDQVTLDSRFDTVCFCGQLVADDPYDPYDDPAWQPPHDDDPMYNHVTEFGIIGNENQPLPTTVFPGQHRKSPLLIGPQPLSPKNVRIQVMRIGDVALATMPGEPTITLGRRIERSVKAALNGSIPDSLVKHVWTTGLANDHTAYFSTIQEYEGYMYEASWSMFGPQTGNELKRRLVNLAEWMALGHDVPPCTAARFCQENPDTSALVAEPEPFVPDVGGGTVLAQPSDVQRFVGTRFTWVGGGPSAEFNPKEYLVALQRRSGDAWTAVATDIDQVLPVRYRKRYGQHRYSVLFDPTVDWPLGTYRFSVRGFAATGPMVRAPYEVISDAFEVSVSTELRLVRQADTSRWDIEHPVPHSRANFRWRARHAATAEGSGLLNGSPVDFVGSITLGPGDELVIPPGGLIDEHGNTNGAEITVGA